MFVFIFKAWWTKMLNLKPFTDDSFSFYEGITASKRNSQNKPKLRQELEAISDIQRKNFKHYDEVFCSNDLSTIKPAQYNNIDKSNLQSLYKYDKKQIQKLKNILTEHPKDVTRILSTCQNCTINEVDSMDHILAKSAFPEFSVHPKNLFPCCGTCNRKKSDKFIDNKGKQIFLNLFLDNLPHSRYLFVKFDKNWFPRFELKKPDDVSNESFDLIQSHYFHLDLLNRFSDASGKYITKLQYEIKNYGANLVVQKTEEYCADLSLHLGFNHREIVLHRELMKSDQFIRYCLNESQPKNIDIPFQA